MKETLIIIGAGGHGKVTADIALSLERYQNIYYIDDNYEGDNCCGHPVIGNSREIEKYLETAEFFVAIGDNKIRKEKFELLKSLNADIATLVHPSAIIGKDVSIGEGSIVMPGTVINAETKLGKSVIINTGATVDHECIIGDYVHISVGTSAIGQVSIGELSLIGAGAVIINNINICEECIIGAGAVVVKDISVSGTYVGVPARKK